MSEALAAITEGLAGLKAHVDGRIDTIEGQIQEILAKYQSTEAWIKDVEEKLRVARFSSINGPSDALLAVLPERHKQMIPLFSLHPKWNKDPVKAAAMCAWLKNSAKLQLSRYARYHAELAEEQEKLEKVLGVTKAAMQEDTDSEGGHLLPAPHEAEVLRALADEAVVRPLARKVTLTSKTLDWPGGDNAVTASIIAEEGTITESNETFTNKQLVAKKFAALGTASLELLQDSMINLLDYYLTVASEKIALLEDDEALEGDGTNFTGISAASGTNSVTAGGTAATLAKEIGQVKFAGPQQSRRNAAWIMNSQTAGYLVGVSDSDGRPLLNAEDIGRILSRQVGEGVGLGEGTILGNPVFTSDEIAVTAGTPDTANVYYGNFRGLIFGDRTGIDFAVSEHVAFTTAQIKLRVIKRTAILVAIPSYFTKWVSVPSS